jgi:recombination protein U
LPCETISNFYDESKKGGRKSIPYHAFDRKYLVKNKGGFPVHYLEAVNTYLSAR